MVGVVKHVLLGLIRTPQGPGYFLSKKVCSQIYVVVVVFLTRMPNLLVLNKYVFHLKILSMLHVWWLHEEYMISLGSWNITSMNLSNKYLYVHCSGSSFHDQSVTIHQNAKIGFTFIKWNFLEIESKILFQCLDMSKVADILWW